MSLGRWFVLLGIAGLLLCCRAHSDSASADASSALRELILATTTSTQDSGLLSHLLPVFEKQKGIRVKVIAVGTGEALALGARGDADVLLVHARPAEDLFMAKGNGQLRLNVMHNDFLLIGPVADPAHVKGDPLATALKKIFDSTTAFASRGDKSGTHNKEQELWKRAGLDPTGKSWYLSTGQGMGETARIATEKQAYSLIDRGTWLALRATLNLVVVSEGDPTLSNPYGVIVVNAQRFPKVRAAEATEFARWLVSAEAQTMIGQFGKDKYGQALFVPDALPESKQ